MTDAEREVKAGEIAAAVRAALPGEQPHALALLLRRSVVLLELEAETPQPEPDRRKFRLHDRPPLAGTVRPDPTVYRIHAHR